MTTQHTPTPWSGGHYSSVVGCLIVGQGGRLICDTAIQPKELAEANAVFIVRACNAHEELLSALKVVAKDCCMALDGTWDKSDEGFRDTLELVEAAIAKAEGK